MTEDEIIEYVADLLWSRGMGSKAGADEAARVIVRNLIAHGPLRVGRPLAQPELARAIEDAPVGSPGYPEEDTYVQGFIEGLRDAAAIVRERAKA